MEKKDYQKTKLYKWEDRFISPLDNSLVKFENVQNIIDYIWMDLGLEYSPKAKLLPKQNKKCLAYANRTSISVREEIPTWVLLHELAHSLTSNFEGRNCGHNSRFVGVYLNLIDKYLPNSDYLYLLGSLKDFNVEVSFEGFVV